MPKRKTPASGLVDSWGRSNRKLEDKTCPHCGTLFKPLRTTSKYCSRPCVWANNGRPITQTEQWWVSHKGYINGRVLVDGAWKAVKQHRHVMEKHLDRPLQKNEDVHHINGVKSDNRVENLELMTHGEHATEHNNSRVYVRGYRLNLSSEERAARSERMRNMRRAIVAKATGAPCTTP